MPIQRIEGPIIKDDAAALPIYHYICPITEDLSRRYGHSSFKGNVPIDNFKGTLEAFLDAATMAGHFLGFDRSGFDNFCAQRYGEKRNFPSGQFSPIVLQGFLHGADADGSMVYFPTKRAIVCGLIDEKDGAE